jgi:SAM-dependent methyltransferase
VLDGPGTSLEASVARYYSAKLARHGATPRGVDWASAASQTLRFERLLEIVEHPAFSINDVGCGYGALLGHLDDTRGDSGVDYLGVDLSAPMIASATGLWRHRPGAVFACAPCKMRTADYAVASGIFNVNLDQPLDPWERFIEATLAEMAATSRFGLAVNFMRSRRAALTYASPLYRTSPGRWRTFLEDKLGRRTRVIEGYGLGEFTLLGTPR